MCSVPVDFFRNWKLINLLAILQKLIILKLLWKFIWKCLVLVFMPLQIRRWCTVARCRLNSQAPSIIFHKASGDKNYTAVFSMFVVPCNTSLGFFKTSMLKKLNVILKMSHSFLLSCIKYSRTWPPSVNFCSIGNIDYYSF
jgi:hypothetical protein